MSEEGAGQDKRVDIRRTLSHWMAARFGLVLMHFSQQWLFKAP